VAVHVDPDASEGCCGSYFDWYVSADLDEVFWFEDGMRAPGEPIAPRHGGPALDDESENLDLAAIVEAFSGAARADAAED
jgi:hypothetical protein